MPGPITSVNLPATGESVAVIEDGSPGPLVQRAVINSVDGSGNPHDASTANPIPVAVTNTPAVTISGTPTVNIGTSPVPTSENSSAINNSVGPTVAASATAITLAASNASRKGLEITNNSSAVLYIIIGTGSVVTSSNYHYKLYPDDILSIPAKCTDSVHGIWASATGFASVAEFQ